MANPSEKQCYVVEDFLTYPYQPTCFQLRSQSFTSPRNLKEFSRRRGLQEQSQSFTCHNEGEERRRVQLGQSYDLSSQVSRSKEGLPARRRLQELEARDGRGEEGKGWERLQSIRRRLQEKRRKQEKENVEEAMAMQDWVGNGGSGWNLDKVRRAESGIEVKGVDFEEDFDMRKGGRDFEMRQGGRDFEMRKGGRDFEMRQGGRDRRQLMRSTSLTAPLSLRPAFARTSSFTPKRRQLKTDLFSSSLPFRSSSASNESLTPSSMYSSLSPESSGTSTPSSSSSNSTDSEHFWNQYRRSPPPISIPDMLKSIFKGKLRRQN